MNKEEFNFLDLRLQMKYNFTLNEVTYLLLQLI